MERDDRGPPRARQSRKRRRSDLEPSLVAPLAAASTNELPSAHSADDLPTSSKRRDHGHRIEELRGEFARQGDQQKHAEASRILAQSEPQSPQHGAVVVCRPRKRWSLLNRFMSHPELMLALVSHLHPCSIVSLYAISKPFHYLFNKHYTTFVLANVRARCGFLPERLLPYRAYRRLCKLDPTGRDVNLRVNVNVSAIGPQTGGIQHNPPAWNTSSSLAQSQAGSGSQGSSCTVLATQSQSQSRAPVVPRQIPGIKWLAMVNERVASVREIIVLLFRSGFLLPYDAAFRVLLKLCFLVDLHTNGKRIGYIHNTAAWTDKELRLAWFIFTRLDMFLSDPVRVKAGSSLRKLLLRQRNLTPMVEVLRRRETPSMLWSFKEAVRQYRKVSAVRFEHDVFGMPPLQRAGRADRESLGRSTTRLLRPDQLVIMEMLRRRLDVGKHILPYMLTGRGWARVLRRAARVKQSTGSS